MPAQTLRRAASTMTMWLALAVFAGIGIGISVAGVWLAVVATKTYL